MQIKKLSIGNTGAFYAPPPSFVLERSYLQSLSRLPILYLELNIRVFVAFETILDYCSPTLFHVLVTYLSCYTFMSTISTTMTPQAATSSSGVPSATSTITSLIAITTSWPYSPENNCAEIYDVRGLGNLGAFSGFGVAFTRPRRTCIRNAEVESLST
jgi:hypothetical protein